MAKLPKWITRDERKVRMAGPEGEVERHRAQQRHLAGLEAVADAKVALARTSDPLARSLGAKVATEVAELATLDLDDLIVRELARLADGRAQLWTCSIRGALLARHLIEITEREDGRWAGDRITMKGERLLRLAPKSPGSPKN